MRKFIKQDSRSANYAATSVHSGDANVREGIIRTHVQLSEVLAANWQYPFTSLDGVRVSEQASVPARPLSDLQKQNQREHTETTSKFASLYAAIERQAVEACDTNFIMRVLTTGHPYTLGITSALIGEGKTTIALHLAMSAARNSPYRVCLIDLSLGEDEICRRLGIPADASGIVSILEQTTQTFPTYQIEGYENLVIVPAGKAPENAAKIARSPHLSELLCSIGKKFDFIIVDMPAVATDYALPMVAHMDGIVMVARAGATPRDVIAKALDYIGREKVLGVVLNRVQFSGPRWLEKLIRKW